MNDTVPTGRPASELSDEELESQGKQLHDTRNWMFLHGTAAQFQTHTRRMLELEQEYLRRFPRRTWQGTGGADADADAGADAEAGAGADAGAGASPVEDPALAVLQRVADSPDGRMHKLEVHQAAREAGLDRAALARLYTADPKLLTTDKQDRVITEAGRRRLSSLR